MSLYYNKFDAQRTQKYACAHSERLNPCFSSSFSTPWDYQFSIDCAIIATQGE